MSDKIAKVLVRFAEPSGHRINVLEYHDRILPEATQPSCNDY